jgi:hypothetical protein
LRYGFDGAGTDSGLQKSWIQKNDNQNSTDIIPDFLFKK